MEWLQLASGCGHGPRAWQGTPGSGTSCPVLMSHQGHADARLLKLINTAEATSSSGWHKLIFVSVY